MQTRARARVCVCPQYKTKMAETTITNHQLAIAIVYVTL